MLCRNPARLGSAIWKVNPLPKVDTTQMRPSCISTICLAMGSPRRVPPLGLGAGIVDPVVLLEMRSWCSSGMTSPVSDTLTLKQPLTALATDH